MHKIWDTMVFSSVLIGKAVGIEVKTPYLDPEFKDYAIKLMAPIKLLNYNRNSHNTGRY
ncbi:hypothetical protein KEJ24_03780 [Candidatus Bathyarchaeota archaeon]|nr:hypothetical protein [Candidatus Bathyarchaeota archaeon]